MITELDIKNIATYDNQGSSIKDLKKINFFFGFNGSGKSTIARYLRNIELDLEKQNPNFSQCSNSGYDSTKHKIITFNADFTEDNFIAKDGLNGIFSLGEKNEEIEKEIKLEEEKKKEIETLLDDAEKQIKDKDNSIKNKEKELIEHCWSKRESFNFFNKITLEHNGSKQNSFDKIKKTLKNNPSPPEIEGLKQKYKKLFEQEIKEINAKININSYKKIRKIEKKINLTLDKPIVGKEDVDIAALIQKLNSRKWVEGGLSFIKDTKCPFCQQNTIDDNLKNQFSDFFNEDYQNKIKEIQSLKQNYEEETNSFLKEILQLSHEFNPDNKSSNLHLSLQSIFKENLKIIEEKIEKSNEKKSIAKLIKIEKKALSELKKLVDENNKICNEKNSEITKLTQEIWNYMAVRSKEKIDEFNQFEQENKESIEDLKEKQQKNKQEIEGCENKLKDLKGKTRNTEGAVKKINEILTNSGFEGFQIIESEKINNISRYYLKRPEEDASSTNLNKTFKTLSEGEKNFISFLYFYQLCLGLDDLEKNSSKKKIIVIDDPVSSLDNQALFIISTLIREGFLKQGSNKKSFCNNEIEQVFIMTHNFYFYKEVSFEKRLIVNDHKHFKIEKSNNKTKVVAVVAGDIKKDEYSLLWGKLKELKVNTDTTNNILVSNIMRRIIESYVNFVGLGKNPWAAIKCNEGDKYFYIQNAFISTINDESHKVHPLDDIYYEKITNENPRNLFETFESIFDSIGKDHYEKMMQ